MNSSQSHQKDEDSLKIAVKITKFTDLVSCADSMKIIDQDLISSVKCLTNDMSDFGKTG